MFRSSNICSINTTEMKQKKKKKNPCVYFNHVLTLFTKQTLKKTNSYKRNPLYFKIIP